MTALATLDDEELYLAALLDDDSGIDLAELTWIDEESPDRCYRVWDFQWPLYHCRRTYQIDQMGRGLGKTVGIVMRAFAFPFAHPGAEMLITAPELNHLRTITDKVEHLLLYSRLGQEMRPKNKGGGINHQPQFQATFINNSRIISRLPQKSGKGVKGQHPLIIELDEGQDYPEPGYVELIETMKSATPGAQWRIHGVSRGVRDTYYRLTQSDNPALPFYVHRYIASHRPSWGDKERQAKIAIYGGTEEHVDYRRNIFGEHGDAHNPLFVLARLMACVRIAESAWATEYNEDVYAQIRVNDELLRKSQLPIASFLNLPGSHLAETYASFWGGMDVGYTNDPSEILIYGQVKRRGKPDLMRLLTRVQLQRIAVDDQVDAILGLFDYYGPRLRRFGMDKTGNGLPLYQTLMRRPAIQERIAGYGFSEKKPVAFEDREPVGKEKPEDLVIEKHVITWATDQLRMYVDTQSMELPYDIELLSEWQGQSVVTVRDTSNQDNTRKSFAGGKCHTLDAGRMMVAAKDLLSIELALTPRSQEPVLDLFLD